MSLFSFRKKQRLTLRNEIHALFSMGQSFRSGPLHVIYIINKSKPGCIKLLVTASRKKFPHAVDRNRLKRLIREAYRLNRNNIIPDENLSFELHTAFIFTGDSVGINFKEMEQWVRNALKKLSEELRTVIENSTTTN